MNDEHENFLKLNHSCEHVFNQALEELYPGQVQRAMGPAIENGWYFDGRIDFEFSEENFKEIEKKMKHIIKQNLPFISKKISVQEARKMFEGNPFKQELIDEFEKEGEEISIVYTGDPDAEIVQAGENELNKYDLPGQAQFVDLCAGPHIEKTGEIKAFKLLSIAGAYWRGDEKNEMLTRVYGIAFDDQEKLNHHLKMLEEAKKNDHRKLGKEMDLFHFEEEIGAGLPLWLPNGNIIKEELENWAKETEQKWGYERVTTPIITKENLFYRSGHLPLYKDSMYAPIKIEEENYYIKPMNCPFHHKVFSARQRSYKDLPLRIAEYGMCHRYEDSGSLFGLMRVRGMDMNDAHIYVPLDQAVEEFVEVIKLHEYYYKKLGIENYEMELALRDPEKMDKYHGDEKDWKLAEELTREAMEKSGVPYKIVNEGAAFYGPKMDFQIKSSIGRVFTASTNQLDLYMGKQFNLEYVDEKGEKQTPAIIHRAPLGTHERFIGFLIEHFGGKFPVWLHPNQVEVIPVSEKHLDYAKKIRDEIRKQGIRVSMSDVDETVGNKIRKAQEMKIPYMLVVGDKEVENGNVNVRLRNGEQLGEMSIDRLIERVKEKIESKSLEL